MNAGGAITTTDASASAVAINVNAAGGGTGGAALRSITTGSGGTLRVATDTGGNSTGGSITQTAATLLNVGTGTVNSRPRHWRQRGRNGRGEYPDNGRHVTAAAGSGGVFITETNGANFTATATGAGPSR